MKRGFERFGRGVYQCGTCGRNTRNTGGDEEGCGLCADCFDIASWDNHYNDNGTKPDAEKAAEMLRCLKNIAKHGGDVEKVVGLNGYVFPDGNPLRKKETTMTTTTKGTWCSGCGAEIKGKTEKDRLDYFAKHVCDPKAAKAWLAKSKSANVKGSSKAAGDKLAAAAAKKAKAKAKPVEDSIITYKITLKHPPSGMQEGSERTKLMGWMIDHGFNKTTFAESDLLKHGTKAALRYFVKRGWVK